MLRTTLPNLTLGQPLDAFGIAWGEVSAMLAASILLQYWQVVKRWKWMTAGAVVAAVAFGLVWTLLATPQYTTDWKCSCAFSRCRFD